MVKLKDILDVAFANKFRIRNLDNDLVVWEGKKYTPGYNTARNVYDDYEVVGLRVRPANGGMLVIDIQEESLL